ncbi:MAG: transglycosylase domain-containing protein [Rhodoglobus sp.]
MFTAAAGLLGFSALAGLLVTVMVTPALAVTGISASSAIGVFDSLPEYLVIGQQPERNEIYATYTGAGNTGGYFKIATIYDQNRQEVSYDNISKFALEAAVDGEDRRFFEHGGVDVTSVVRATLGQVSGNDAGGGSTLSMQLVKNIFVQQALQQPTEEKRNEAYDKATAASPDRKLKEMKLAIGLEKKYTKKEILTAYLNIAFFGDNTYGIQAAAQRYYSVDAKDLSLTQAASLVAIVQYPLQRGPFDPKNYTANQDRRDQILRNMYELKDITKKELDDALATPVDDTTLKPSQPANGCSAGFDHARWFCDYVVKNVKNFEALGPDEATREANWKKGGYKLYTTLDLDVQINAQEQLWAYTPNAETELQLGGAAATVQPGSGRVLVMAENKVFNDTLEGAGPTATAVNYNTSYEYGGSSGIQPGSTYKLFTLLAWLQAGKGLNELVNGNPRTENQSKFLNTCTTFYTDPDDPSQDEPRPPYGGTYTFKNDSGETGNYTVMAATAGSINGAFISMGMQVDQCSTRHMAEALGVVRADGRILKSTPSAILGINEVTPLSMAGAYATMAAGGLYCAPVILDRVVDPSGAELPGQTKNCHQAIDAEVAAAADYALQGVVNGGTASASDPDNGIPHIGKTGTTDGAKDTWVAFASTGAASVVWVGNIVGDYSIRNYSYAGVSGGVLRHVIMNSMAGVIDGKYGGVGFPDPPSRLLTGSGVTVPDLTGKAPELAKSILESLGLTYADGGQLDSEQPAGAVAATDPGAGSLTARGSQVNVFTSKGNKVPMPDVVSGHPAYGAAQGTLAGQGFTHVSQGCEVTTDPTLVNKVVSSSPAPGAYLVPTDPITLNVGKLLTCP